MGFSLITLPKGPSTEITNCGFSLDARGITMWLIANGIINSHEIILRFADVMPWRRAGGETYSSCFEFMTRDYIKTIYVKAIITLLPDKNLMDWQRRRSILSQNGVPVSNWYSHSNGLIFEDFYNKTCVGNVSFYDLIDIAYRLDKLGFTTLKFTDDIRANVHNEPFYVDFGFDLGEPSEITSQTAKSHLLELFPEKNSEISAYYQTNLHE